MQRGGTAEVESVQRGFAARLAAGARMCEARFDPLWSGVHTIEENERTLQAIGCPLSGYCHGRYIGTPGRPKEWRPPYE
jgi:hypothetical protein